MKVAVVSPPFLKDFCRSQRWPVVNRTRAMRYPDFPAYCAGVLIKNGFETTLMDSIAMGQSIADVARWTAEHNPRLVVMDATTPSIYSDIECARACKQANPQLRICFVGPHVSVHDVETLRLAAGAVDFVTRGEYDYTVRDLAMALDGGQGLESVAGLSWMDGGEVRRNVDRTLIENLDDLPLPPWGQLDVRLYRNNTYLYPYLDIISGRGCPNRCMFCQWPQVMTGRCYRYCSPERVVAEMVYDFDRFPIKELFFEDDTLTTDAGRLKRICELILQQKRRMVWSCNSRVDMDLSLLPLMKEAGCRMVLIGPESGNQQVLKNVHKGIRLEQTRAFVDAARKARLSTHACWVVGLPGETRESINDTIRFALELDTDTIQASSVMPQVGTELFDWAKERGYLKMNSWADYAMSGEQTAVMEYPDLKIGEINGGVNTLLRKFYFRPRVIFRLLGQSLARPSLLWSYFRGFLFFVKYIFTRAALVEKK